MATSATTDHVLTPARPHSLLADYATLFKVRISTMVIITAGAGFYLGCLRSGISPFQLDGLKALVAIAVVTCGSSALNQALERNTDSLMPRTATRGASRAMWNSTARSRTDSNGAFAAESFIAVSDPAHRAASR